MNAHCIDKTCPRYAYCYGKFSIPKNHIGEKCSIMNGEHSSEHGKDVVSKPKR